MTSSPRVLRTLVAALFPAAALLAAEAHAAQAAPLYVYFGTYTKGASKGIYRSTLDPATGRLSAAELAAEARDPAFLAVHPNGKFLYAIEESSDPVKTPGKGVNAYAIDSGSGKLTLLNQQSAAGPGPCHLEVDRTGKAVFVANYSGGSVVALPLGADGRLGAPHAPLKHEGSSVNPARQKAPHAHAITLSPDNRFALSPDLGIDKVQIYRNESGRLVPHTPAFAPLPPGSGPRHLAFSLKGDFVYVINELLCTVSVFSFDTQRGEMRDLQLISTLPEGETVQRGFSTAEIAVHPSGRFVYGSNRGHNTIAVFAVDAASGKLKAVQHESTQGRTPRHFALDPSGQWLLAENQDSNTVVVFRIDPTTGRLTPAGHTLEVPAPVCAVFVAGGTK